jgi:hypothetical protein
LKVLIHFRNAYERRRDGSDIKNPRGGIQKSFGWSSGGRLGPGLRRTRGRDPAEATVW